MIRAKLSNGDYLFGIDAENVRRLKAGKPIVVPLGPLGGPPVEIIITYGDTLDDIRREIEAATGQPLTRQ